MIHFANTSVDFEAVMRRLNVPIPRRISLILFPAPASKHCPWEEHKTHTQHKDISLSPPDQRYPVSVEDAEFGSITTICPRRSLLLLDIMVFESAGERTVRQIEVIPHSYLMTSTYLIVC